MPRSPHGRALTQRAREFRRNATPAEQALWSFVRGYANGTLKFRRQVVIGPFIADIACHSARLVIEADGPIHDTTRERDAQRDDWFREAGYTVLRFTNDDILQRPGEVQARIRAMVRDQLPGVLSDPPSPPEREGLSAPPGPKGERGRP